MMKTLPLVAATALVMAGLPAFADVVVIDRNITESDVLAAQQGWCDGLVAIATTYSESGHADAKALAEEIIDAAYGYQLGGVLFRPTLAKAPQTFRLTRAGAISYFVGGDPDFPQDSGFASKGWTHCEFANAGIFLAGDSATSMGKVHFTHQDGSITTVDKTVKFFKDGSGITRIVAHHSSLEYDGP